MLLEWVQLLNYAPILEIYRLLYCRHFQLFGFYFQHKLCKIFLSQNARKKKTKKEKQFRLHWTHNIVYHTM